MSEQEDAPLVFGPPYFTPRRLDPHTYSFFHLPGETLELEYPQGLSVPPDADYETPPSRLQNLYISLRVLLSELTSLRPTYLASARKHDYHQSAYLYHITQHLPRHKDLNVYTTRQISNLPQALEHEIAACKCVAVLRKGFGKRNEVLEMMGVVNGMVLHGLGQEGGLEVAGAVERGDVIERKRGDGLRGLWEVVFGDGFRD